ncbi:unnamed protein product [Rangifer tarandus platyrhynchus]|uniref:Uncharacterized protein n=2 Tax=Rangifer tarandus platyrhynchus TaxID=3082113 RepID=A0ACB0F776_RANTA|nr:unnamed protein product [Rangifer tarandus platyrhynchus]CAI9708718.1 unnamed protein product [Rangifer tarandus platyrhynchus]
MTSRGPPPPLQAALPLTARLSWMLRALLRHSPAPLPTKPRVTALTCGKTSPECAAWLWEAEGVGRGSASPATPALGWALTQHARASPVSGPLKLGSGPPCCHLGPSLLSQSLGCA